MSREILDIDPEKWNSQLLQDISGSQGDHTLSPYVKYEYSSHKGSSLRINTLKYKEKELTNFLLPGGNTTKLYTYFAEDRQRLLAIQIEYNNKCYYYTNRDTSKPLDEKIKFDKLIAKDGNALSVKDLKQVLENVKANNHLDYADLSVIIKENLWQNNDIYFDLSKELLGKLSYHSDVTGEKVIIKKSTIQNNKFLEVNHIPGVKGSSFHIRGFDNSSRKQVIVNGGFPYDLLKSFTVYYISTDHTYTDPLLVVLTPENLISDPTYVSSKYLISKDNDNVQWEIRRVKDGFITDNLIEVIVKNINENKRLNIEKTPGLEEKLQDITEDLVIDFTKTDKNEDQYISGDKQIPYKKTTYDGYTVVSHADTFDEFTVKEIKTGETTIKDPTIPINTKIHKLYVFYHGTSDIIDPLMICILQSDDTNKWLSRHLGDEQWTKLTNSPTSHTDSRKILELLSDYSIPSVKIDVSKSNDAPYTPDGTKLDFKVEKSQVTGSKIYYIFQHTKNPNGQFNVKEVLHYKTTLKGITSTVPLSTITAYYLGDGHVLDSLLLVELVISGGNNYKYFHRVQKDGTDWKEYPRTDGGTGKLTNLKETLDTLKKVQFPQEKVEPEPSSTTTSSHLSPRLFPPGHNGLDNETSGNTHNESTSTKDILVEGDEKSSQSTFKDSSTSSGTVAGAVIGGLVCVIALGIAMWKVGPSMRVFIVSRNPPL